MNARIRSIRPFIGAKDFNISRSFYTKMDFQEVIIDSTLSYFAAEEGFGFYLQNYYAKQWVENSMIFLEVTELKEWHTRIAALNLPLQFPNVKLSSIRSEKWGQEFFLHDPSGVLWHIGTFT